MHIGIWPLKKRFNPPIYKMTYLILTACSISLASTIFLIFSPLPIGLWILLISFVFSLLIAFSINSWFSLIFFLVYVGGLLVIFAYFVALSPNQQLSLLTPIAFLFPSLLVIILLLYNNFHLTPSSINLSSFLPQLLIYSPSNAPILIRLALLLFFALIAVVKISGRRGGPLRPFNKYV